jgi:SAM-dependent methyltransferase
LRRSVELLRAFRVEQTDPDRFYSALAADSVQMLRGWCDLRGAAVLDVGGGPGYFADAFTLAGARYAGVEPDAGELTARGQVAGNVVRGSGLALPISDGSVDVAFSSNVLEHVSAPERMADEMLRVLRPRGLAVVSWTPWLSPWGGHETSPWHYLGGRRAADRYAARHGHRPKNDVGRSLFPCSVGRMLRWARRSTAQGRADLEHVLPRYHPWWAQWVITVPALREVACWNAVIVLRRR